MNITLITFAFVALVTVGTPGPTVLLALTNGSRYGLRRAGIGIFGAALSDIVLIACAAFGLGAVLSTSAFWFSVVKWVGVIYLAWLGVQMLRSAGQVHSLADGQGMPLEDVHGTPRRVFQKSFLVAVTNPKGYLFFAAFLPQFIVTSQSLPAQYATLTLIFVVVDVAVMAIYAALGAHAIRFLRQTGAMWLERVCGATLLILAGTLASYRNANA
ncbi:MAG: LysE family translocator [Silicimonas sp.]|nr:LysE family translocator [Silicimonas sp.]